MAPSKIQVFPLPDLLQWHHVTYQEHQNNFSGGSVCCLPSSMANNTVPSKFLNIKEKCGH
jgi:hypothetical protein